MRLVFVRFSEEIEDTKKPFRNYLTFKNTLKLVMCNFAIFCNVFTEKDFVYGYGQQITDTYVLLIKESMSSN